MPHKFLTNSKQSSSNEETGLHLLFSQASIWRWSFWLEPPSPRQPPRYPGADMNRAAPLEIRLTDLGMLLERSSTRGQSSARTTPLTGCSHAYIVHRLRCWETMHTGCLPNLKLKIISYPQSVARNQANKADVRRERTELNGQLW